MIKRVIRPGRCQCGCGRVVSPGKRFICGHHLIGVKRSEEFRAKMRVAMIGKNKGKKISHKQKMAISLANKGKVLSDETKRKISKANKGSKRTEEVKRKMSKSHRGLIPWNKGKKHTIEARKRMSKSHLTRNSGNNTPENPYPKLFYISDFRDMINERDGNICQNPLCRRNCEQLPLEFHHIDYNKGNCVPSNIIKVCKSCNARANSDRQFWQKHYETIIANKQKEVENVAC